MRLRGGFTLIELLVVVAIVGLVAVIAVVNYRHAVVRSRVARVKAELRSLSNAVNAYAIDKSEFPPARSSCSPEWIARFDYCRSPLELTTPIAYIGSLPPDPFNVADGEPSCTYKYLSPGAGWANGSPGRVCLWVPRDYPNEPVPADGSARPPMIQYCDPVACPVKFALWSVGPAGPEAEPSWVKLEYQGVPVHRGTWYDPRNGITSRGVIARLQGGITSP